MGRFKQALVAILWRGILRPLFFCFIKPELTHKLTMRSFSWLMRIPGARQLTTAFFRVNDPRLRVRRFGLEFLNPVGLAAGLDKDAQWCDALQTLGFGFIEVGTVTAKAQDGNPEPRLYRLPKDQAILNRMGSPNRGADVAAALLASRPPLRAVLGVNIGKTASVPNDSAVADYLSSFEQLYPFARYFALNISSPNTPALRALQARESLEPLLRELMGRNVALAYARQEEQRPILVKIAPDLEERQLDEIVELCLRLRLDGIIVANTTISREGLVTPAAVVKGVGAGGLSGRPLTLRSRAMVAAVFRKSNGALPIVGVGGIMTEEDAWQMIRAGASLVQVHSGLIYQGPGFVAAINRHLANRLAERRINSIMAVIGEATKLRSRGASPAQAPATPAAMLPPARTEHAV